LSANLLLGPGSEPDVNNEKTPRMQPDIIVLRPVRNPEVVYLNALCMGWQDPAGLGSCKSREKN